VRRALMLSVTAACSAAVADAGRVSGERRAAGRRIWPGRSAVRPRRLRRGEDRGRPRFITLAGRSHRPIRFSAPQISASTSARRRAQVVQIGEEAAMGGRPMNAQRASRPPQSFEALTSSASAGRHKEIQRKQGQRERPRRETRKATSLLHLFRPSLSACPASSWPRDARRGN